MLLLKKVTYYILAIPLAVILIIFGMPVMKLPIPLKRKIQVNSRIDDLLMPLHFYVDPNCCAIMKEVLHLK